MSSRPTILPCPAPMARRTPISRCRVLVRANIRFAAFPQTASNKRNMMPCRIARLFANRRCGPRGVFQNGSTSPWIFALVSG